MIWALHQHNSMLRSVRNGNSEQEEIERWRELVWYLGRNPSSHKLVLTDGSISRPLDLHNMLLNRRSPTHRHVSYMCVLSNYTVYVNTYGQCMQIIVLYCFYCCKYRLYGRVRIEYLSICYVPVSALHSSWHGLRKPVWKTLMTHFIPAWIYSNPQKASCFFSFGSAFSVFKCHHKRSMGLISGDGGVRDSRKDSAIFKWFCQSSEVCLGSLSGRGMNASPQRRKPGGAACLWRME